jgi:predicted transcriptional regulator
MKTAVSIPDDVFQRAERLARGAGRSRSDVYSSALREYVARHDPDEVTRALDRVTEALGESETPDDFVRAAARRSLANVEW